MNEDIQIAVLESNKQIKAEIAEICKRHDALIEDIIALAEEMRQEAIHELKLRNLAMINLGITYTMMHEANYQQKERYIKLIDTEVERIRK